MTCPDIGAWRAWIDGESTADVPPVPSTHLIGCVDCRATVESVRANAALAGRALEAVAPSEIPSAAATALAREQVRWRTAGAGASLPLAGLGKLADRSPQENFPMVRSLIPRRARFALAGVAAALVLAIVVTVPQAQTAAAAFLAQFRSQRFVAVTFDPTVGRTPFALLRRFGSVQGEREPKPVAVGSLAEASAQVGFPVKLPSASTLPAGLVTSPTIRVMPASERRFRLERAAVDEYLRDGGHPPVAIPANLDGATLVIAIPAAVLLEYPGATDKNRMIVVGEAGELTARVEGNATLDELRDFLLGLPGLPSNLVSQLRGIQDWRTTLPIPVPVDKLSWQQTSVGGTPGLLLADNSGVGSAVIFQRDGRVYGVAGTTGGPEVVRIAESIR